MKDNKQYPHFESEVELMNALRYLLIARLFTYKVAAQQIGISVDTIVRRVKKHNLKPLIKKARAKKISKSEKYGESLTAFRVDAKIYDPEASAVIERRYEKWLKKR